MKARKTLPHMDGLASLGLILFMIALTLPRWQPVEVYRWIAAAGALILLVARIFTRPEVEGDLKLTRLMRIQLWSAIFFCAACVFLFVPGGTMRDFLAFTLAGAAIQIYTSIAIPARLRKLKKNG
ncbi:MAG: hypothetical protein K2L96_02880 [Muribaculaceae bacterium]|nr:hypothetical protein [Muribaculaceae bacterium]